MSSPLERIEAILQDEFQRTPFHNLFYLGYQPYSNVGVGGTCSDKVLEFKGRLEGEGISSRLHSGYISGRFPHRLLYIKIDEYGYFADVGNGWPSVQLLPANRTIRYVAYGIGFSTVLRGGFLELYQSKQGKTTHSLSIPLELKKEHLVVEDIQNRFDGHITYPFNKGLRFAQVVRDQFIFIKKNTIRFFLKNGTIVEKYLTDDMAVYQAIEEYFSIDISHFGLHYSALEGRNEKR